MALSRLSRLFSFSRYSNSFTLFLSLATSVLRASILLNKTLMLSEEFKYCFVYLYKATIEETQSQTFSKVYIKIAMNIFVDIT